LEKILESEFNLRFFLHADFDNKSYWEFLWMAERLGKEITKNTQQKSGLEGLIKGM